MLFVFIMVLSLGLGKVRFLGILRPGSGWGGFSPQPGVVTWDYPSHPDMFVTYTSASDLFCSDEDILLPGKVVPPGL